MSNLLLVEDDESLGQTLKERLEKEGYQIKWARNLAVAQEYLNQHSIQLILLDVGLPDGSGFEFAKEIHKKGAVPFIFLTAQTSAEDRLRGYELGAVEFIPKPFHLKELLIRLKHVLSNHVLDYYKLKDGTRIDFLSLRLIDREGKIQEMSLKEMKLLKLLIARSPLAVSRDTILDEIWGEDHFPNERTIDNVIVRLRQLLGHTNGALIHSIRGLGYQWLPEPPQVNTPKEAPPHGGKYGK